MSKKCIFSWTRHAFCFELVLFSLFGLSFLGYQLQNNLVQIKRLTIIEQQYWRHKTKALDLIQKLTQPFPKFVEKEGYRICYHKAYHAYDVVAPDQTQVSIYRPYNGK